MPLPFIPRGVIPAALTAFADDFSIDVPNTRAHFCDLAAVDGLSAVVLNGHAAEVHACSEDEQRALLDLGLETIGDRLPVVAGIYADGSHQAQRLARMAEQAGASALLVFPPAVLGMGGHLRPDMLITHFRMIAEACSLPIIFFEYPTTSGLYTPFETMLRLFAEVPAIVAIKDWCHDGRQHERNIRMLQSLPKPIQVLSTHSAWAMASLSMGCAGLLSGAGSVVAAQQVELFRAIEAGDLPRAQQANDRLYPMQQVFYQDPFLDMHNRMKEVAVILGRLPKAVVRPPLMKLSNAEIAGLRQACIAAGLLKAQAGAAHSVKQG
jgi:4-hydroxy-tetrahydrodipicolinate synthase